MRARCEGGCGIRGQRSRGFALRRLTNSRNHWRPLAIASFPLGPRNAFQLLGDLAHAGKQFAQQAGRSTLANQRALKLGPWQSLSQRYDPDAELCFTFVFETALSDRI